MDRYCCQPVSSSSSTGLASQSIDELDIPDSSNIFSNRWLFLQLCTIGIFLAIALLLVVMVCQCVASMRQSRYRQSKRTALVQLPLPAMSPLLMESSRLSTISSTPSDLKSRCTDTSLVLNTPLNLYPTSHSRSSTSSSSYYMYPNEFEQLCK